MRKLCLCSLTTWSPHPCSEGHRFQYTASLTRLLPLRPRNEITRVPPFHQTFATALALWFPNGFCKPSLIECFLFPQILTLNALQINNKQNRASTQFRGKKKAKTRLRSFLWKDALMTKRYEEMA